MSHPTSADAPTSMGWRSWSLIAAVLALLSACQPAVDSAQAMEDASDAPATSVQVALASERGASPDRTQLAKIEAAERVEIRPRVGGQVLAVLFREGERVTAGQALFRLDPRPFDIAVGKAEADLKLAVAREQMTRQALERAQALMAEDAISSEEKEQRESTHQQALAQVAHAKALLDAAHLDREFATVRAPIDGAVGRALGTQGHQVVGGPSQAPLVVLTSSVLHVHLDAPQQDQTTEGGAPVTLPIKARLLSLGDQRPLASATLDFKDPEVQSQTGSVRLRGRVDGEARSLMPGQHVLVSTPNRSAQKSLWIPDRAVGTDQGRHYALVVRPDQTVEYRVIELGVTQGQERQVLRGLQPGEAVVTDGLMRVRPGSKVSPTRVDATAGDTPAAAAQPAQRS